MSKQYYDLFIKYDDKLYASFIQENNTNYLKVAIIAQQP